jgi:hypothetical protein
VLVASGKDVMDELRWRMSFTASLLVTAAPSDASDIDTGHKFSEEIAA